MQYYREQSTTCPSACRYAAAVYMAEVAARVQGTRGQSDVAKHKRDISTALNIKDFSKGSHRTPLS